MILPVKRSRREFRRSTLISFPKIDLVLDLLHHVEHLLLLARIRDYLYSHRKTHCIIHTVVGGSEDAVHEEVFEVLLILLDHCDWKGASCII